MNKSGFSLVEVLAVTFIIATLSGVLVLNFRSSPTNSVARSRTASVILSDIRRAQALALSGSRYQNGIVCGYGFHYIDSVTYSIYAVAPISGSCFPNPARTRNYKAGDIIVQTNKLINSNMLMAKDPSSPDDVFFQPPDPKTFINNDASFSGQTSVINIQVNDGKNQKCNKNPCTTITVYSSGKIDVTN